MIWRNLLCLFLVSMGFVAQSQPVNDNREDAITVPHTALWKSADAAYTNVGATVDGDQTGLRRAYHNVWFKFQATTPEIDVRVLTGNGKGTMQRVLLTLWDSIGDPVIQFNSFYIHEIALEVGDWYWISVDDDEQTPGTFTLQISNHVSNDLRAKAVVLPHTKDWASGDAVYSNIGATGSWGDEGGSNNVWFKFQATTAVMDLRVLSGGSKGTIVTPTMFFWDDTGVNLLVRSNDPYKQLDNLVPGQWYYISVESLDDRTGTFSLRLSNEVDYDMREFAEVIPHTQQWRSGVAAYSNEDATGATFHNEPYGPKYSVWFKFQATTVEADVRLLTGGEQGTGYAMRLGLWDDQGTQLMMRSAYLQRITLTVGEWYYISVDAEGGQPGTFGLTLANTTGYDLRSKAEVLTNVGSWQSADAAYTTLNATGDTFDDQPWGGKANVWFRFQAQTTDISIQAIVGAEKGTLSHPVLKLFSTAGVELKSADGYLPITSNALTPGEWYYFSVDHIYEPGTFTLKIFDHVGYDMKAGAEVIQHAAGWCTDDAYYSTVGATADESATGSCGAFRNNVWFTFKATGTTITIKMSVGDNKGTLRNPALYLVSKAGATLVCNSAVGAGTAEVTYTALTKGDWYYVVADSYSGNTGTFSLCIDGGSGSEMNSFCKDIFCDGKGGMGVNTSIIPEGFKLSVKGKIISEGVKVELQTKWPDFVFKTDYDLAKLEDLKVYIDTYGHLPNIPSEAEVQQDGIDLAVMNALLLQKIEEMTLHMIRFEERSKQLEARVKELESENK